MVDSQFAPATSPIYASSPPCRRCPRRSLPPEKADLAPIWIAIFRRRPRHAGEPVRRLLKPMVLAKLLQAAEIAEGDHVLDVGCATGYASAVLARLAHSVVALELEMPGWQSGRATICGRSA